MSTASAEIGGDKASPPVCAVSLVGLTATYPNGTVGLEGVDLAVPLGRRLALLGPNGSGKSSVLRVLQGGLTLTKGSAALFGAPVGSEAYWRQRQRVVIVPQSPGVYPDLTTREYIDFVRGVYGQPWPGEMVERFGLGQYIPRLMSQLSGGFQRRVVLAAALGAGTEVILLDEPTVGLGAAASDLRSALADTLRDRTLVLCTHDLAEAEAICDDVVLLREGRVKVSGAVSELKGAHRPRVRLAARQGAAQVLAALHQRGLVATIDETRGDVEVEIARPEEEVPDLLRGLLADGLDIFRCDVIAISLEEIVRDALAS